MNATPANRQRVLVIATVVAVALLIGDRVLFTPLTNLWRARSTDITRLEKNVGEGRSLLAHAGQIQATWAQMQAHALPKDAAQAEQQMISAVDTWGKASAVELGSIKPQWKRGASPRYSLLECRVDATGSLDRLTHFLYELENSPLALRVDAIELTARDPFGQKLSLGVLVTGLRLAPLEAKR